jgi:arginine deiminase
VVHRSIGTSEGGDILVLDKDTLMIGTGERTIEDGLYLVMSMLLEDEEVDSLERVVRVVLPEDRSSMHLDTVLTIIDRNQFLAFGRIIQEAKFFIYQYPFAPGFADAPPLSFGEALAKLGMKSAEIVNCGGDNPLFQSREQWTDGANLFAIAPGVVVGYDRNVETAKALREHGYRYLEPANTSGRKEIEKIAEQVRSGEPTERILIGLRSSELSRAPGGARCMTLPLERDPVQTLGSHSGRRSWGFGGIRGWFAATKRPGAYRPERTRTYKA